MSDAPLATGELTPLKRALLTIERLQARVRALEGERAQPVAVVGMGCRFPGGSQDPESYFRALLEERDAISPAPAVARPGLSPEDAAAFPPAGYLQEDVGAFDAPFFGISPREAASIDPQQRLVLECAWEALEDAGIDPRRLAGTRSGVFVGLAASDYENLQLRSSRVQALLHTHFASGIGHSMASGRLAYLLGLHGPAVTLDTACSSSLVAVHMACQSLRAGESDLALAAGVNVILSTDYTVAFQQSRMLAADGRCRTFDADAEGFSRAEGCGVVVLKRLADAERDGDRILAVVRGSAVNQDGPSSGLTAPNGPAQEAVIRAALAQAGLAPGDIGYVEAHGTGTTLGDPIEVQALGAVFNDDRPVDAPLLIGSVKTNLGHLEAAAGMAGLVKVVQSLRHAEIPAHLHLETPSPHIPWSELKLEVPTQRVPFPVTGGNRRAGISAFGFSGTNVHIVLEAASAGAADGVGEIGPGDEVEGASLPVAAEPSPARVLALSAADESALHALAMRFAGHLESGSHRFGDVCATANAGRAQLAHRLGVIAQDGGSAAARLRGWLRGETDAAVRAGRVRGVDAPRIAFLFTGQGSQHTGMGWALRQRYPVVRAALDECAALLHDQLDVPLLQLFDPSGPHAELIHRTDCTQPAIFALQYALAELWRSWGIEPTVVAGHSIGEFAAAQRAGVFALEDALRLVALRGRLMQAVRAEGAMEAVFAEEERVRGWIEAVGGAAAVAGINAPDQIVVSGTRDAVAAVIELARGAGVTTRSLRTSQAFHSPLMDGVAVEFAAAVDATPRQPGRRVRFVSGLTGASVSPEALAETSYWSRQLREPVRFAAAAHQLGELADAAVEIGPHPALSGLVAQNGVALPVFAAMQRDRDEHETLVAAQRDLFLAGARLDWAAIAAGDARRIALPTYPFQRIPLWVDLGSANASEVRTGHPLLGQALAQPGETRAFERTLSADAPAFIGEHNVLGRAILPGTAFIELALAAGHAVAGTAMDVSGMDLLEPTSFAADERRRVHTRVERDGEALRIAIHSAREPATDGRWTLHATAQLVPAAASARHVDTGALRERCTRHITGAEFARDLAGRGYTFGPRLQCVRDVYVGDGESLGRIGLTEPAAADGERYHAHPLLLDAGLQVVGSALEDGAGATYLPVAVERVGVSGDLLEAAWVHALVVARSAGAIVADAVYLAGDGTVVGSIDRITFREVSPAAFAGRADPFLVLQWEEIERASQDPPLDLAPSVQQSLSRLAEQEDAAAYDQFVAGLEAEAEGWVRHALAELGGPLQPGSTFTLDALAQRCRVMPAGRRLLDRLLSILSEAGWLARDPDGWRVLRTPPAFTPLPPIAEGNGKAPEQVLLRRCGPRLAAALQGKVDPLELLFPGGDGTLAEQMYFDSPMARMLNGAVAEALAQILAATAGTVRVLEVGGGTAGTTRRIVEGLLSDTDARPDLEYTFTDISPLFVERARRRFADLPGFRFTTYDLDGGKNEPQLETGSFDVIVAANCLHAARDLEQALRGVRALLRPGGVLLAPEVFAPHRWFDLTVGLTDGWWHFTDTALRPDYTCIDPERWSAVLARAGFDQTHILPVAAAAGTDGLASRGQGLVLATASPAATAPAGDLSSPAAAQADPATRSADAADADPASGSAERALAGARWLIIDDDADGTGGSGGGARLSTEVQSQLESRGAAVTRVSAAELPPFEQATEQLAALLRADGPWSGVLHCAAAGRPCSADAETLETRLQRSTGTLLALGKALSRADAPIVERLCVLTRAAQPMGEADLDAVHAAVCGLARSIALELPELPTLLLDLEAAPSLHDAERVTAWLHRDTAEPELAWRGDTLHARRLRERAVQQDDGLPAEYRLTIAQKGAIDHLHFGEGERREPAAGQVEIRVAATALNFKDVLNVLGMYPGDAGPLGSECAGVVTRVGAGVELKPGDAVVASVGGAYARHVVVDAAMVARRPARLGFAEAAALPVAYLTAHFALNHLGRMAAGDRVLIHAAAGGVGLAACALAQRAGAEVFATAGSEEKRALLRSLGVRHVFDSRSTDFAAGIMQATEGRGITVVLNSLADEAIESSFAVLARGGRFLEIGKRGIWTPDRVRALDRDIDYHIIDWGETAAQDPALIGGLLREVIGAVEAGELPPLPVTTFPLARVRDAFRFMAQARHKGKIVLQHPVRDAMEPVTFRSDAAYMITGGTAGLGLETAVWAVRRGARTLLLVSRSEPSPEALARIDALRAEGAAVHVWQADIGDGAQVRGLLERAKTELPPLRGVIHGAGALADGTLASATWPQFHTPLHAKVFGTTLLGEALRETPLDFFVAYSSIAGVLGSPAQGNHAAANAFLDVWTAQQWAVCTGMSIAWGPWGETGAAVRADVLQRTRARGLDPLGTRDGLAWIDRAFADPAPLLVGARITDAEALAGTRHRRLLSTLKPSDASRTATIASAESVSAAQQSFAAELATLPAGVRRTFVVNRVKTRVRAVLALPPTHALDAERPLGELGLDSLLAIELRNTLSEDAAERLPATMLFDHPTVAALADHLMTLLDAGAAAGDAASDGESLPPNTAPVPDAAIPVDGAVTTRAASRDPFASVDALSDDEVERLLAEKLGRS